MTGIAPTRATGLDARMLALAARAALRGAGDVEPNPTVGCVLGMASGVVLGVGHHRRLGGAHAEVEALRACERRGASPRGATAWVTLEPCNHTGRTGPCSEALLRAGVAEVVIARPDPNPLAAGGAAALLRAGVRVRLVEPGGPAWAVGAPFAKRVETGLPWVIAKWAQTPGGRTGAGPRPGESRWISGPVSLRRVHRLRARADAVIVGSGTALADDPMLTARGVARVRRVAERVVIDPRLRLEPSSALARSARETPLVVVTAPEAAGSARASALAGAGAVMVGVPTGAGGRPEPVAVVRALAARGASTVLVEGGPTLLRSWFAAGAVDEAWVFLAPGVGGVSKEPPGAPGAGWTSDPGAARAAAALVAPALADERGYPCGALRRSGADALVIFRRAGTL